MFLIQHSLLLNSRAESSPMLSSLALTDAQGRSRRKWARRSRRENLPSSRSWSTWTTTICLPLGSLSRTTSISRTSSPRMPWTMQNSASQWRRSSRPSWRIGKLIQKWLTTRVFELGINTQKVQAKDNKWQISSSLNSDSELTYRLVMVHTHSLRAGIRLRPVLGFGFAAISMFCP